MKFNILIGGKAGQGPNLLSELAAKGLIAKGYYVFYSRDYQSLIRGGHNFNVLSFSENQIHSNGSKIDIIICLDENTIKIHKKNLNKKIIILNGQHNNTYAAGELYKILGLDFNILEIELKKLDKYQENLDQAKKGYSKQKTKIKLAEIKNKPENIGFLNASQALAISSLDSGLEYYYAYPMTPATPLLTELAQMQLDKHNKHKIIELESEIAVINAALGSSIVGAKTMIGTSGGGFDLMTESLSLSGMAEIPLVIYLAQRPGPSTGIPTYTSQGDLNMALHSGHGEFSRIVICAGDIEETINLTNQAFYFSQKYKIPSIILSDKHLAECKANFDRTQKKFIASEKSITELKRYNSYEHDENGNATEDSEIINKNFERRLEKQKEIEKDAENFEMYKVYGDKNSKKVIVSFGSTKGAILDAIEESKIKAKFIQILYLDPFSKKIKDELKKADKIIVIENNSTSQLSRLIAEKTQIVIEDKNKILRYDGRPFLYDELAEEIKKRLK